MLKNSYCFSVGNRKVADFEFIVGPMAAVSIPQPPMRPEAFIQGCFEGGATPILAPRDTILDHYLDDIKLIKARMRDNYIGVNIFAPWSIAADFLKKLNALKEQSIEAPDFVDINAIELNFEAIMPLLETVSIPMYLGMNQPAAVYAFRKYLQQKPYAHLIDRFKSGMLKVYLPQNHGGGHLPIFNKEQENDDWAMNLLHELMAIENDIGCPIPFIVEKGMLTIQDFIGVIEKFSPYPGFSGVRFASVLEATRESGLNTKVKELLAEVIANKRRDMVIPIRSVIGAMKTKNDKTVRGGVISYVLATDLAKKIHRVQCAGEDFPKFSRNYSPEALLAQTEAGKASNRKYVCTNCISKCPKEYCEIAGSLEAVSPAGDLDVALVHITPNIFDIDPEYIDAPVAHVVRDIIAKVLDRFDGKQA